MLTKHHPNPSSVTVPLWLLPALPHTPLCTLFSLGPAAFPGIIKMLQWSRAATTKTFSSTTNTVLAATLHSPEDHPPHWSQFPMSPRALKDKKLHKLFCWRVFFFVKASSFLLPISTVSAYCTMFSLLQKSLYQAGRKKIFSGG